MLTNNPHHAFRSCECKTFDYGKYQNMKAINRLNVSSFIILL